MNSNKYLRVMEGREVETATGGSGEGIMGLKRELDVVEGNEMV